MLSANQYGQSGKKLASLESRLSAGSHTLLVWIVTFPLACAVMAVVLGGVLRLVTYIVKLDDETFEQFLVIQIGIAFTLPTLDGIIRRATFGMRLNNLFFASPVGEEISHFRCMVRIIVGFILIPLLPVSALIMARNPENRSLADLICGTSIWWSPNGKITRELQGFEVIPLEKHES
jgi:uncharacterized RDD family membrane protein YckC